jgi:hypothetical protein
MAVTLLFLIAARASDPPPICPPAPDAQLVLPQLDPATGEYALADGRRLLYDTDDGRAHLWAAGTLTDLGRVGLVRAGQRGWLVWAHDEAGGLTFSDVDPTRPALRPLWSSRHHRGVIGEIDGAVAVLEGGEPGLILLCVSGPGAVTRHPLKAPEGLQPAGEDAIRGHRLLMTGPFEYRRGSGAPWEEAFTADVWILDLDTTRARRIGKVPGGYTRWTAVPHPVLEVRWATDPPPPAPAEPLVIGEFVPSYAVDPVTEALR